MCAVRRKKKAAALDFENLPHIPEGAFAPATRRSQMCLAKLKPKDTLLPEDVHYEVPPTPPSPPNCTQLLLDLDGQP